jgi:hypothetical protein
MMKFASGTIPAITYNLSRRGQREALAYQSHIIALWAAVHEIVLQGRRIVSFVSVITRPAVLRTTKKVFCD